MKQNEAIPQKMRDVITVEIAKRRWLTLQKHFKAAFYDPGKENKFPFFLKLSKLFSEYAASHLNTSRDPCEMNASEAEKTAYIMHLLDGEDYEDISLLRCEPVGEDQFVVKSSNSYSVANKVRRELAKLPKESICVQKTKLKIVPNTPFNRQYQLSTIINQRNSSFNRRNATDNFKTNVKKRTSSLYGNEEISIIQADDDSINFEVQALDECSLGEENHPEIKRFKKQEESLSQREASSDLQILEEETMSILEVPSIDSLYDEDLPSTSDLIIKPKKLQFRDESSSNENEPPKWFQSFLSRYDEDMKKVDNKLSLINEKLDKVLARRSVLNELFKP